jgi:large subunit ribosomal protein L10
MSRKLKEMIETELKTRYGSVREAVLVNAVGLTGVDANLLRRQLRAKKYEMHVVPNRLFKRSSSGSAIEPLAKAMSGPCAIVTGGGTAVEMAKELLKFAESFPKLELKIGLVEGIDEPMPVPELAKLRGRLEVIGDVAAIAISPGKKLAGAVGGPGGGLAACLKTLIGKLEKGEAVAKVA